MSQDSGAGQAPSADVPFVAVRNRGLLMVGVVMIATMQFLDSTIANVALPQMKVSLGAANDTITWVLTSFIVAGAVFMPMTGWLSERVGSRNLFLGSSIMFLVASAACGTATSLEEMVLFRVIQGIATAFIAPLTQTILFDISPPSKQPQAMALYGVMVMVAPISGPFIGGFLTEHLNWRWVFLVNLPIGIPALLLIWSLLPNRPAQGRRLDLAGLLWLALAIGSLQLLLDRGEQVDWFSSWEIIIEGIVAVSAFWIYLIHNHATAHPLFSRELFKNQGFLAAMVMMFVVGVSNVSLSAITPMLYQNVLGYPVMQSGVLMAPRGIGTVFGMLIANWLVARMDFRALISLGYVIVAGSLWLMTQWSLDTGDSTIISNNLLMGLGLGLLFAPLNVAAFSSVDARIRPDGTSLLTLVRNIGSSVGISSIVTLLAHTTQVSHSDLASHVTAETIDGVDLAAVFARPTLAGDAVPRLIDAEINRQAAMIAFIDSFYALFWLMLVMALLPLAIRKPPEHRV